MTTCVKTTKQRIDEILNDPKKARMTSIALANDFKLFIKYFHFHCDPEKKEFIFKPFHLDIIKELEDIVFQRSTHKNLIINLVPRYGKSIIMQYLTAWSFARNKGSNFIYTSFSDALVLTFSDKIRSIIQSELFYALYGLNFSKSEDSKRKWTINEGGGIYAASQGGAITGFGCGSVGDEYCGALIVDDPIKPKDARSELMRQNCIDYFEETLSNRLNNPKKTPIIIIMQRLHQYDLCGYIEENDRDNWKILTIPAFNEDNHESIWPEKHDKDFFLKLRDRSPYYFYSQFQQKPISSGNSIYKVDNFNYYDKLPDFNRITQSWDTAFKAGKENDYSVCTTWGTIDSKFGKKHYLIDVWREKAEYPKLKQEFTKLQTKYNPYIILVEDKASGQSLLQDLRQKGNSKLRAIKADNDKVSRATAPSDMIYNGDIYLPEKSNWLSDFLSEVMTFPNGKHDDQVDSMNQALNFFNRNLEIFIG